MAVYLLIVEHFYLQCYSKLIYVINNINMRLPFQIRDNHISDFRKILQQTLL